MTGNYKAPLFSSFLLEGAGALEELETLAALNFRGPVAKLGDAPAGFDALDAALKICQTRRRKSQEVPPMAMSRPRTRMVSLTKAQRKRSNLTKAQRKRSNQVQGKWWGKEVVAAEEELVERE